MTSFLRNNFVRVLTLVLIVQGILYYSAARGETAIVSAPLSGFPVRIGPWTLLSQGVIEQDELDMLKADDTLTRVYSDPAEGVASLFVAYFKTQRTGQSPHSPKNCLPGSGWQPSASGTEDVSVGGQTIRVNRYLVSKGDTQSLVLYWYQSHGRVIADEFKARFYLIKDSIREHRSDTALVRVVVPFPQKGIEDRIGTDFVKTFYPAIEAYLPK